VNFFEEKGAPPGKNPAGAHTCGTNGWQLGPATSPTLHRPHLIAFIFKSKLMQANGSWLQ